MSVYRHHSLRLVTILSDDSLFRSELDIQSACIASRDESNYAFESHGIRAHVMNCRDKRSAQCDTVESVYCGRASSAPHYVYLVHVQDFIVFVNTRRALM